MSLSEVCKGTLNWADFLHQESLRLEREGLRDAIANRSSAPSSLNDSTALILNDRDLKFAAAVWADAHRNKADTEGLEFSLSTLARGVSNLSGEVSILLGDVAWKLEMQQQATLDNLQQIRLAEFEREASAYRLRAERAYLSGWYEESLHDFLAAEQRNYPDYAVLRSIANIYLYHLVDLPRSLEYFRKAAKYARPNDVRSAVEASFFAGIVCILTQQPEQALHYFQEATRLNPQFAEAHYQHAAAAMLTDDCENALNSLELAIISDERNYERAKFDALFDTLRPQVNDLLERLAQPIEQRAAQLRYDAEQLQGYVIAETEREKLTSIFQTLERQKETGLTYRDRLQMLERLEAVQQELQHIHERFDKRYAIDPRDYVRSIAFSNQGHLLAAGFLNGGVQLWEVDSMMQLRAFLGHYASVNSVAFSPNDQLLVTGSRDRAIKLWETDSGREIQILHGHSAEVRAVTFSPDGQWLVSGSHDKTIRIWRAATGHEVEMLRGHTRPVTSVLFSPDGRMLVSGSWDHTIRLWDLNSGKAVSILTGHSKGLASLAISPDGRWLASGGEGGEVKLWDLQSGEEIHSYSGLRNSVTSVAFSPDGSLLAAGSLGVRIMVWQRDTAEVVRKLEYENISYNSVAFSPRGQWLAFGNRDLQLWLKVILTEEEYAAVKAGEERALRAAQEKEDKLLTGYVRLLNR